MRRLPAAPVLALVGVQISFASLSVVGKAVLEAGLPPLLLAGLRVLFASLLLSALAFLQAPEVPSRSDLVRLASLALLGVVFNQVLFLEGLSRTSVVNASLLIATIPVFTLLITVLAGRERFDSRRATGVVVAFAGALVLLRAERFDLSNQFVLGDLLVVLNCLSYSLYLAFSRDLLARYRSSTVVAWTFLFGALVLVPTATPLLFSGAAASLRDSHVALSLLWIILVPSVAAYGLNNFALKRLPSSTVASFIFLQPLLSVAMAVAFLPDEHLEPRSVAAGLLILLGVLFVVRAERTAAAQPASP